MSLGPEGHGGGVGVHGGGGKVVASGDIMAAMKSEQAGTATLIEGGQALVGNILSKSRDATPNEAKRIEKLASVIGFRLLTLGQDPEEVAKRLGEPVERLLDVTRPSADDTEFAEPPDAAPALRVEDIRRGYQPISLEHAPVLHGLIEMPGLDSGARSYIEDERAWESSQT